MVHKIFESLIINMKKLIRTITFLFLLILVNVATAQGISSSRYLGKNQDGGITPERGKTRVTVGVIFLVLFGTAFGSRKLINTFYLEQQHTKP